MLTREPILALLLAAVAHSDLAEPQRYIVRRQLRALTEEALDGLVLDLMRLGLEMRPEGIRAVRRAAGIG